MSNNNLSLEQLEQFQTDRFITSIFSLWNSLIVLNGLIIGTISVLYLIHHNLDKLITLTIFLLSTIAIMLFIWNFYHIRSFYHTLGRMTPDQIRNLTDEQYEAAKEAGITKSKKQRIWIKVREIIATIITFINLVFFMVIITY